MGCVKTIIAKNQRDIATNDPTRIHESRNCFNFNDKYLILDPLNLKLVKFYKKKGAKIVKDNFHYDSFSNKKNLSKKQLMKLQRKLNN